MTNSNIAHTLLQSIKRNHSRPALIVSKHNAEKSWTFGEIEKQMYDFCQALLKAGIRQDDRVILMVPPSMEFVALTLALFVLKAPIILIDPGMGYKNLLSCIGAVQPKAFIGIPKAQFFRRIFPKPFKTVTINICVGPSFGLLGSSLYRFIDSKTVSKNSSIDPLSAAHDDLAAIIFTTGSTGPPKGVQYTHGIFQAQLRFIRDYYGINAKDIDQPAFPLFALFALGLGATAVIPDMDPTRPAQVDPKKFIASINRHKVTYSFGSPALWKVVGKFCQEQSIKLPSIKKVLMAGAPIPGDLIEQILQIISPEGEVYTPYGATECLPIVSMNGREIIESTWPLTMKGQGTCVGRPLPGVNIQITAPTDGPISSYQDVCVLAPGEIGEIIVQGEVVTKAYDHNDQENHQAKIHETGGRFWHRIGDMGYIDSDDRLWFCGRKAHRVTSKDGVMYSVCCEAIFNQHPDVSRSALVGIGPVGKQQPVVVVELNSTRNDWPQLSEELRRLGKQFLLTEKIDTFFVHKSFPVDIRHNAKIFREKLAIWAAQELEIQ